MAKTIKAVFINTDEAKISHVDIPVDAKYHEYWQAIYKLCGWDIGTMVQIRRGNMIIVDDEGLLKDPKRGFQVTDYPDPLAGNAVIVGPEKNELVTDCNLTNEEIKAIIKIVEFR